MAVAREQIRQIIAENNFTNVADVYDYLKEGFKGILQELMEAEMNATLDTKRIKKVISLYARGKSTGLSQSLCKPSN